MFQRNLLGVAAVATLFSSAACTTGDDASDGTSASVSATGSAPPASPTSVNMVSPAVANPSSAVTPGNNTSPLPVPTLPQPAPINTPPAATDPVNTSPANTTPVNTEPVSTTPQGSAGANVGGASNGGAGNNASGGTSGMNAGGSGAGGAAGSAAGNAGTAGSASGGAGSGGGSSLCPASALFCEDFESGNLDQWEVNDQGGSLSIGTGFVANGASALLVDVPANQHGGFLRLSGAPLFPLPNQVMYGRAMVLFETIPDGHTDVVRAAGNNGSVPFYNLGEQHEEILLNYFESYPGVDCWARPQPGYSLTAGEWMCWEWRFDGNTNEILFYINGELERTVSQMGDGCLEGNALWDAPDFATFEIGAYVAELSANRTERFWIDDVAIGTEERIACPTP